MQGLGLKPEPVKLSLAVRAILVECKRPIWRLSMNGTPSCLKTLIHGALLGSRVRQAASAAILPTRFNSICWFISLAF